MIAIRLGLYLSLILLPGLALFPLYALRKQERRDDSVITIRMALPWLSATGLILSAIGFLVLLASMSGNPLGSPDWEMGRSILFETAIGTAWQIRMAALSIALVAAVSRLSGDLRLIAVALAGAVALSSLVWTGHAGANEWSLGLVHKISDIVHLLAAAIWLGGIAGFLLLMRKPAGIEDSRIAIGQRALEEFSRVGTICVIAIAITGLVNSQILVGYSNISGLFGSTYGQLLLLKLLLVGVMLTLAAKNRWQLTPSLKAAMADGDPGLAIAALRRSLLIEGVAAAAILALVAWLGTLEPVGAMPMH
jgi:putative copper resistance protein D